MTDKHTKERCVEIDVCLENLPFFWFLCKILTDIWPYLCFKKSHSIELPHKFDCSNVIIFPNTSFSRKCIARKAVMLQLKEKWMLAALGKMPLLMSMKVLRLEGSYINVVDSSNLFSLLSTKSLEMFINIGSMMPQLKFTCPLHYALNVYHTQRPIISTPQNGWIPTPPFPKENLQTATPLPVESMAHSLYKTTSPCCMDKLPPVWDLLFLLIQPNGTKGLILNGQFLGSLGRIKKSCYSKICCQGFLFYL